MFASILVETGLYITKSYKSDLITQKAHRQQKASQQRSFDQYYAKLQVSRPAEQTPFESGTAGDEHRAKKRHGSPEQAKPTADAKEPVSKKEK